MVEINNFQRAFSLYFFFTFFYLLSSKNFRQKLNFYENYNSSVSKKYDDRTNFIYFFSVIWAIFYGLITNSSDIFRHQKWTKFSSSAATRSLKRPPIKIGQNIGQNNGQNRAREHIIFARFSRIFSVNWSGYKNLCILFLSFGLFFGNEHSLYL